MANVPISVPAESTVNLVAGSFDAKIPSAKVIYKYFPNKPLKFYRHNVFRALIFYEYLRQIFELLIGSNEIVNCLGMQYSSVVTIPYLGTYVC
jgi:hypothetical protein